MRNFGLKVGIAGKVKFEARIKELVESFPDLAVLVEPLLVVRRVLREQLSILHRRLLVIVRDDDVCRRLMTVPGVGRGRDRTSLDADMNREKAMKRQAIYTAVTAIVVASGVAQRASALDKTPVLSLDLAKKMTAGCEAKAKEMSWKMNISIVDTGANEIFL